MTAMRKGQAWLGLILAIMALVAPGAAFAQERTVSFDPVFGDHAVLQRDQPLRISGRGPPSSTLTVTLAEHSVAAVADADGKWTALLPALAASGPHRLVATDNAGGSAVLEDVMLGDVFLCGGQSNMSYLTRFATNASAQLRRPVDTMIRFATIPIVQPAVQQDTLRDPIEWHIAGPETIGESSAVCYYMALELKAAKDVTIGFVRSSLGGTAVESWLSASALRQVPPFGERVAILQTFERDPEAGRAEWQAHVARWWESTSPDGGRMRADYEDAQWDWARIPGQSQPSNETIGSHFSGAIWYRHTAILDAADVGRITALDLGTIVQDATIWINGRRIGAREGGVAGAYAVPQGLLTAGRNVVAVRLLDHGSAWQTRVCLTGCAWMTPDAKLPLTPDWRYQVVARMGDLPLAPRAPWTGGNGLGSLYNGMIAPLAPYAFKGVVWYQGESNVADPANYRQLLPLLMRDWRTTLADPDLPFVLVQLTAFGPVATRPVTSDWAELREVQRQMALTEPNTALVVSIDVGDRSDIHPAQKKIVGQRVARAMRNLAYGDPVRVGGPRPIDAVRRNDDIVIRFSDTDGGLLTYSSDRAIGFETCNVARECRFADARVEGDAIVLPGANQGAPGFVRYAWANSPIVNLYGRTDIPAIPFELEIF